MRLLPLALLLAFTGCANVQTIASASSANRLYAANQLYAVTARSATDYAAKCKLKPTTTCKAITKRAQAADAKAYAALDGANTAYRNGDSTDLGFLIGAADGLVQGFATYFPE